MSIKFNLIGVSPYHIFLARKNTTNNFSLVVKVLHYEPKGHKFKLFPCNTNLFLYLLFLFIIFALRVNKAFFSEKKKVLFFTLKKKPFVFSFKTLLPPENVLFIIKKT